MPDSDVRRFDQVLAEHRAALVAGCLPAIGAANAALAEALAALQSGRPAGDTDLRRIRLALRAHAELVTRVQAANHRALAALTPPSSTYGNAPATPSTGTHLIA